MRQNMYQTRSQENWTVPVHVLRESLRQSAVELAAGLSRSVGRMTSYDALPCMEYGAEVSTQRNAMDAILYVQLCRDALEHCVAHGHAALSYRWMDGARTKTRFRKTRPEYVKATGLVRKHTPVAGSKS